jgi:hypothetical protein
MSIYKTHRIQAILKAFLFISICTSVAQAQFDNGRWVNGISEPWWFAKEVGLPEQIALLKSLWEKIGNENLKTAGNKWAGDYFIGSDQSGFVLLHVNKCAAQVESLEYGEALFSPTLIQLRPQLNSQPSGSHTHSSARSTPTRLLPVKWRGAHYLVPENEMAAFGDYAAGLGAYNAGLDLFFFERIEYFYKLGDKEEGSADELPVVPPGYERFIKKPINAKIIAVGAGYRKIDLENEWWDHLVIPVTINVGSSHGVKPKMLLRIPESSGSGGMGESVLIKQAGRRASKGIIVRDIRKRPCVKISEDDDCKEPEYSPVKAGWQVTTNPLK